MNRVPIEDVRKDVSFGRPHLVILGAGASRQAFPYGDVRGRKLPTMTELIETLGLKPLLSSGPVPYKGRNFEEVYSDLADREDCTALRKSLDDAVREYFTDLELPGEPTLYDYLLLSLRPKDSIATFNWDPLLFMSALRLADKVDLAYLMFLHGNVAVGYCDQDRQKGNVKAVCSKCLRPFKTSRLLYPVRQKNYQNDVSISREWHDVEKALKSAYALTIFGYSAPVTDVEAKQLMTQAWGRQSQRELEQIELIDVISDDDLRKRWGDFILEHHYEVATDFFSSRVAKHPRRSCEAIWSQFMEMKFFEQDPLPRGVGLEVLIEWIKPYLEWEARSSAAQQGDGGRDSGSRG